MQQQQATADGQVLQQTEYLYEPGSFRPMAQVTHHEQGSELHYIVTDHAGTPQELCNEQGDIVWRGEQALWGHYHGQSQRHWQRREEAANDSIKCDLRYQGQLEDPESGLYYNVNRYYDADSGQYLSPDPIGFAGGLRPQAYVANPLEWVDPLGLMPWPNPTKQGHHLIYKNKAASVGWDHLASNSTTPTFFFDEPYTPGSHEAIHRAQRPYVGKVQGPWTGSPEELLSASKAGLGDVDWIKGSLKIPATGEVLAENVTPLQAFDKLEEWHQLQLKNKKGCK
ncbi:RHS repeat-associated core domain-containing protein [Salinivibrio sp. MA427]|uniref:RHS repeat domain-containing protein n=1 Tax=Salinivibrio sp. MA427 TaxID=1909455 RepID=UPI001F5BF804|nr:RHS repeat-associated core domain-containing protein [Salinivibrio sp. MA427]